MKLEDAFQSNAQIHKQFAYQLLPIISNSYDSLMKQKNAQMKYTLIPDHWRNHIPPTYYNTHSLGPIMHVTEAMPVCVSSQAVSRPEIEKKYLRRFCKVIFL